MRTDKRTDRTKIRAAVRNFANATQNWTKHVPPSYCHVLPKPEHSSIFCCESSLNLIDTDQYSRHLSLLVKNTQRFEVSLCFLHHINYKSYSVGCNRGRKSLSCPGNVQYVCAVHMYITHFSNEGSRNASETYRFQEYKKNGNI